MEHGKSNFFNNKTQYNKKFHKKNPVGIKIGEARKNTGLEGMWFWICSPALLKTSLVIHTYSLSAEEEEARTSHVRCHCQPGLQKTLSKSKGVKKKINKLR